MFFLYYKNTVVLQSLVYRLILPHFLYLMLRAIDAAGCSGCSPDPSREAYAFVFSGGDSPELGGLRAAAASIRLFDAHRDIVVATLEGALNARSQGLMAGLARAFGPWRTVSQPRLAAWDLLANQGCRGTMIKLSKRMDELDDLIGQADANSRARAAMWANITSMQAALAKANISKCVSKQLRGRADAARLCSNELVTRHRFTEEAAVGLRGRAEALQQRRSPSRHSFEAYERPLREIQMFGKFRVWSLWRLNYTRVLYMDTDVLVTHSLEPLWQTQLAPHEVIAATPTLERLSTLETEPSCAEWLATKKRAVARMPQVNAGLYLLRPTAQLEAAILGALMQPPKHYACGNGDQSALNSILGPHTRCASHVFNCYDPYFLLGSGSGHLTGERDARLRRRYAHQSVRSRLWWAALMEKRRNQSRVARSTRLPSLVRLNRSEIRLWGNSTGGAAAFRASCASYTCATLRDWDGSRTRCLEHLSARRLEGTRPTAAKAAPAATASHEMPEGEAHEQAPPLEGSPSSAGTGHEETRLDALIAASARRMHRLPTSPPPRPTPIVLHFMHTAKPWSDEHLPLRRSNYFFWLWHVIDEAAAAAIANNATFT